MHDYFAKGGKALVLRLQPDTPPAVLDILFDNALFPPRGNVAEVGIEQVVRAHHRKAGIDRTAFALVNPVDGGLHVVLDAPARHTEQGRKHTGMGIEEHLVALAWISRQPERAAGTQLQVRHQHASINAANQ